MILCVFLVSDRIAPLMQRFGSERGEPIQHRWVTKAIENAQRRVEAYNFEIRKHLLEYDDVMNKQRITVYSLRRKILESDSIREIIYSTIREEIESLFEKYIPKKGETDIDGLAKEFESIFNIPFPEFSDVSDIENLKDYLERLLIEKYEEKISSIERK